MSNYIKFPEPGESKEDTSITDTPVLTPNSAQSKFYLKYCFRHGSAVCLYIQNGAVFSAWPCYCHEPDPTAQWSDQP